MVYGGVFRSPDKILSLIKNINKTSMGDSHGEKVPSMGTSYLVMEQS